MECGVSFPVCFSHATGVDDYQFIPFIWGSSQLIGHKTIKPKSVHEEQVLETQSDDYLYVGCIRFIKEVWTWKFFKLTLNRRKKVLLVNIHHS